MTTATATKPKHARRATPPDAVTASVPAMNVQVLQMNLDRALTIVSGFVPKRPALPILTTVKLETHLGRLRVTATDLDLAISVLVGAKVNAEGATAVPYTLLKDLVRACPPATVSLDVIPADSKAKHPVDKITMLCARMTTVIDGSRAEDFPRVTDVPADAPRVDLHPAKLAAAIKYVLPCIGSALDRPVLAGVLVEAGPDGVTLVAADGFRLAITEPLTAWPNTGLAGRWVVPSAFMARVAKLFGTDTVPVELAVYTAGQGNGTVTYVAASTEGVTITARTIDGAFPHYAALIPDNPTKVAVSRDELAMAVKRAAIIARNGSGIIRLQTGKDEGGYGMLTVSAFAAEEAEISIELGASIVGPDAKVALNSRYIQDALATASETVTLEIDTPSTPVLFRSVVGRTVVMPMFCQW